MVSIALLSLTLFILCQGKRFFCSHSALPGEKSGCSHTHQVRSLPLAWTNLALPDPFVVVAAGKAVLRFSDLQQLTEFLKEMQTHDQEDH